MAGGAYSAASLCGYCAGVGILLAGESERR
jgi:hypothetical protein